MRVAVTGLGALTPVGRDAPATWKALQEGRSGIAAIDAGWAAELPVSIAGQVDPGFAGALSARELRRLDRAQQFAMVAGREAWADAGPPDCPPDRIAVVVGSAIGGLRTTIEQQHHLDESGPRHVSPHTVTMMMANGAAGWLSMEINARAGARTPVSACASGSEAVLMAREMILSGSADVVLAGGTEACITGLTLSALAQARALSRRGHDPRGASRPFDAARDGFVLGEGAAMMVLEREDLARNRGARIDGFVEGAALTSDAHDIVAGDPKNQARTMTMALRAAELTPSEIGVVLAHATSTPLGDVNESRAIIAALGRVPVTSTKSMVGHLLGASGALGAVVATQALRDGVIPPTINVEQVDPEVEVDVVRQLRQDDLTAVLVNAFGFGGHNVCLVVTRR